MADEEKLRELKDIKKEQDANLQNLQSNAFQLANYYFVFQGVIITAICSGTSALNCSDRWFLFTVSLLAAILNIVAICLIGIKYMRVSAQRDLNWCEICNLERSPSRQNSQAAPPSVLPPPSTTPPPDQATNDTPVDRYKNFRHYLIFVVCMGLFVGFAGVTLYNCWHIVCRKNQDINNSYLHRNCIRICDASKCIRVCSEL